MTPHQMQLIKLSEIRFERWLKWRNIRLQPHQKKLCLDIFKLDLSFEQDGRLRSFAALGSGLRFTFDTAREFIKDMGEIKK